MKPLARWLTLPSALAIVLASTGAVLSQAVVAITPSTPNIELKGTSGGGKTVSNCAEHVSAAPNHVIKVAENTNLRITLQAAGQPALLIRNPSGQEFCVPADSDSGGKISIPGRWTPGDYSIYVGDRSNGQYPYTLSIAQN